MVDKGRPSDSLNALKSFQRGSYDELLKNAPSIKLKEDVVSNSVHDLKVERFAFIYEIV